MTPGLSAPIPAPGVMRQAARWMLDGESPLLVRPRVDLDFLRWSLRFAQQLPARRRTAAGTAATLALAQRHAASCSTCCAPRASSSRCTTTACSTSCATSATLEDWLDAYAELEELGFDGDVEPLDRAALRDARARGRRRRRGRPARAARAPRAARDADRRARRRPARAAASTIEEGVDGRSALEPARRRLAGRDRRRRRRGRRAWSSPPASGRASCCAAPASTIPLEAAKGYSVTAPGPEPAPSRPLYLTEAKVGASPFAGGSLRLAGTLELNGIDLEHQRAPRRGRRARGARPTCATGCPGRTRRLGRAAPARARRPADRRRGAPGLFVATGHAMLGVTLAPGDRRGARARRARRARPPRARRPLGPRASTLHRRRSAHGRAHACPR